MGNIFARLEPLDETDLPDGLPDRPPPIVVAASIPCNTLVATPSPWYKVSVCNLGLTDEDWTLFRTFFRLDKFQRIVAPHLNPTKVLKMNLPNPCPFFELDTTEGSLHPDPSPFNLSNIHFGLERLLSDSQPDVVMVPSYRMLLQTAMEPALNHARFMVCTKVTNNYVNVPGWHQQLAPYRPNLGPTTTYDRRPVSRRYNPFRPKQTL